MLLNKLIENKNIYIKVKLEINEEYKDFLP